MTERIVVVDTKTDIIHTVPTTFALPGIVQLMAEHTTQSDCDCDKGCDCYDHGPCDDDCDCDRAPDRIKSVTKIQQPAI